jgi:hypothetical protein
MILVEVFLAVVFGLFLLIIAGNFLAITLDIMDVHPLKRIKARGARSRQPPRPGSESVCSGIQSQARKVKELTEYVDQLKYPEHYRPGMISDKRQAIRNEYLDVSEKKLAQERAKLEAMQIEEDREEFERRMGG